MSGGHFDHTQYNFSRIADEISDMIYHNDSDEMDQWGSCKGNHFTPETIDRFREAVKVISAAYVYAQRIDWLVSGDDGEDTFHDRLEQELKNIGWDIENVK